MRHRRLGKKKRVKNNTRKNEKQDRKTKKGTGTMRRFAQVLLLAAMALLMGNTDCHTPAETNGEQTQMDPEKFANNLELSFETAVYGIELAEAWATVNTEPSFGPCMAADPSKEALTIAAAWVDPIKDEAVNPDGHLTLEGGVIDVNRCFEMHDVPDPWPPVAPNEQVILVMQSTVPAAVGTVKLFIMSNQEPEGPSCIQAEIWMGILGDGTQGLESFITDTVLSVAAGKGQVWFPGVTIDYEGCGLEFNEDEGTTVMWGGPEVD